MDRYVCIHGHFYQPPRENPWLEDIELQDSAYPYHDWNERITAECYEPNTASRILDNSGRIKRIVNNYARISFNFGPTLLDWLATKKPDVYQAVIAADRESMQHFSGHGSALAQAYNHMIMPLACTRDKYTQVIWGLRDFEHRFGRRPEGMWLPETAVDLETLEIMAEQGIRFTILSPYQARRVRKIGAGTWEEPGPGGIDPSMPYLLHLPASGRSMNVFFYDGPISRAVAFEKLLANGEHFAKRLVTGFAEGRSWPQLLSIATDGETYGHHHHHGDMALAYALHYLESNKLARITNYSEYLEKYPPSHEVEIHENSSWSCCHGVERWRSNCGCNSGQHPGWNQAWRAPLRNALNFLRNTVAPQFEEKARRFLKDPWAARNDYISVLLDRSPENVDRFLARHAVRELGPAEQVTVLKLLELQRHAMLMFTSCGWFFDDISGIETVQVLQYAARVIQLAEDLFNNAVESKFLEILSQAKSNIPEHRDGAHIYEKFAKPAMVDLPKVGAHYAISSLFETYGEQSRIYCYTVERKDAQNLAAGKVKLTLGQAQITSDITRESVDLSYGVLYFGEHNVNAGVRVYRGEEAYREMVQEISEAFDRADLAEVLRLLDNHFEGATYSLKQLFRDKQRRVLETILDSTLAEIEADYRQIYERHASLMRFLKDLGIPQPKALHTAAEFIINISLRRAFAEEPLDFDYITALLNEAGMLEIPLDGRGLGFVLEKTVAQMAERLRTDPTDLSLLASLEAATGLARSLPFEVDLWKVQNIYYDLLLTAYQDFRTKADAGDETARQLLERFNTLGDNLRMRRGT
jgi:alpha-amylase/alpha-mannosidase (GH57 family)